MICDAGGGTVVCNAYPFMKRYTKPLQDLAAYKIIGLLQNLEIAEIAARSGANCGSLFLDLRFRDLVQTLLVDHPAHLDPVSLAYFMHAFSETEKVSHVVLIYIYPLLTCHGLLSSSLIKAKVTTVRLFFITPIYEMS